MFAADYCLIGKLDLGFAEPKSGENGGGGIRTLVGPIRPETVFETAAFNRSATPPGGLSG
jgi:hypothetical protein